MPTKKDFYSVLGVERAASADEIRRAHRRLARELHPDVNKKPDAAARFNEIQEAYDVLSDAEKRAVYDRVGHAAYTSGVTGAPGGAGRASGAGGGSGGPRRATYTWSNIGRTPRSDADTAESASFDAEDIGSIFQEFFGRGGAPRPAGATRGAWVEDDDDAGFPGAGAAARARPRDAHQQIDVPFLMALSGGVQTLRIQRADQTETIDVTIPKGIDSGARLRLRGKGPTLNSGSGRAAGDLILEVRVLPHPRYRRDGLDLSADLPVSITEAALGARLEIETPRAPVGLTVPPGTSSGARLRLKGRGVETADGRTGDFYAVVKIVPPPPSALTDADREALRKMGERWPGVRDASAT